MLFPTIRFAVFFLVVLPVSWALLPRRKRWLAFMIGASWFFYGAYNWRLVALLAGSTLFNQLLGVAIHRTRAPAGKRVLLWFAVAGNLGLLGYFKYTDFLFDSGASLLNLFGVTVHPPAVDIVLPIGISFITFQALSYVIDIRREKLEPGTLLEFAAYLAFFPHVVAGPIVRAAELIPQFRQRIDPRKVDVGPAFWLIAAGLFKKVVVASYLADRVVDHLFANPADHGGLEALVGVYAYAVQIFADFSGYTDIAIGLAALLGFRFPQNFDAPYTATSVQDFWRRWHMTLSRWLRDYVYIQFGGNRGGRLRTYRNLFLTMLLGGLWHGAAWTFVAWGALHGGWQALERWRGERRESQDRKASRGAHRMDPAWKAWIGRLVTFHVVCLGWIFFRADSFTTAFDVIKRILFHPSSPTPVNPVVVGVVAAMVIAQYVPSDLVTRAQLMVARAHPALLGVGLALVLVMTDVLGPQGVAPFIYFAF